MNWLIKQLGNEKKYYPIFLLTLAIYSMLGCVMIYWVADTAPKAVKLIAFLFMIGSAIIGYSMRAIHNLAYAKINERN